MSNFVHFTIKSIIPYKSLPHLQQYFYFSFIISTCKNKNNKYKNYYVLSLAILLYQALHLIYLFLCPSKLVVDRFSHSDIFFLLLDKPTYNAIMSLSPLQTAYTVYVCYFKYNQKVNFLLEGILVKGQTFFFLHSNRQLNLHFKKLYFWLSCSLYQFNFVISKY